MKRDSQEIVTIFHQTMSRLERHCKAFDEGEDSAAIDIAVVLRTLLYTNNESNSKTPTISLMDQMPGSQYQINYLSTCMKKPKGTNFIQGWNFCGHIHNTTISIQSSVFAGLITKTINDAPNGGYVADVKYMANAFPLDNHTLSLDKWLAEEVFFDVDKGISLSRLQAIKVVSNKDGGSHYDDSIPEYYDIFRHPTTFKIYFNGQEVPFSRNPVYETLRQIAWEVIESFKQAHLIN